MATKVVIDTSALVKRLTHRSRYAELLDLAAKYDLLVSDYLLKEYERVLVQGFGFTKRSAKSATRFYERISTTVRVVGQSAKIRDPNDEPILNLCHQQAVGILVSDDKDFTPELLHPTKLLRSTDFFKS
jgi:putative PIN family toxin of toxin-antitoxin system